MSLVLGFLMVVLAVMSAVNREWSASATYTLCVLVITLGIKVDRVRFALRKDEQ